MTKKTFRKTFPDGTTAVISAEHDEETGFQFGYRFLPHPPQVSIVEAYQEFKKASLGEFLKLIDPKGEMKIKTDAL